LEEEDEDEDEEGAGVDEVAGWAGGPRVDARGERGPPPCVGASPHRRLPMSFNFTDHQSIDGCSSCLASAHSNIALASGGTSNEHP
jgi:hypothetical protein